MKIVCNGCSFTAAEHLYIKGRPWQHVSDEIDSLLKRGIVFENPIEIVGGRSTKTGRGWPYWLGRRDKNIDTVNIAVGGGGNDRIFRTTVEYISQYGADAVAIQWSNANRWEYQCIDTGDWVKINANSSQGGLARRDKDYLKWMDLTNMRYTPEFGKYRNYRNELALKQFCAERNIPIFFWIPSNFYQASEWHESPKVIDINTTDPHDGIHPDDLAYKRIARIINDEWAKHL
jgi:hypothetical protein